VDQPDPCAAGFPVAGDQVRFHRVKQVGRRCATARRRSRWSRTTAVLHQHAGWLVDDEEMVVFKQKRRLDVEEGCRGGIERLAPQVHPHPKCSFSTSLGEMARSLSHLCLKGLEINSNRTNAHF
jgi:hypothetical protein